MEISTTPITTVEYTVRLTAHDVNEILADPSGFQARLRAAHTGPQPVSPRPKATRGKRKPSAEKPNKKKYTEQLCPHCGEAVKFMSIHIRRHHPDKATAENSL